MLAVRRVTPRPQRPDARICIVQLRLRCSMLTGLLSLEVFVLCRVGRDVVECGNYRRVFKYLARIVVRIAPLVEGFLSALRRRLGVKLRQRSMK
jgi:hypothetical protein